MEVTRDTFDEALPLVRQALSGASFVAIDCEMSGLFDYDSRPWLLDDTDTRYYDVGSKIAESAKKFGLLQFGLSAFAPGPVGLGWIAKTFNFYLFPAVIEGYNRRFLSEAGSLRFLSDCGFDFSRCFKEGVLYMPVAVRDARLRRIKERLQEEEGNAAPRDPIIVKLDADVQFVEEFKAQITSWLASEDDQPLMLASRNSFQRALQHQELRKDQFGSPNPPGFYVEVVKDESGFNKLQLIKGDAAAAAAAKVQAAEKAEAEVWDAAAFTLVLEALRDSGVPVVGHNAFFDLAYTLESCVSALPHSWALFKDHVHDWLVGGFWDTKYLAGRVREHDPDLIPETVLSKLYTTLETLALGSKSNGESRKKLPSLASVDHAAGFTRYNSENAVRFAHEAGYDAFMTGACFARLAQLLPSLEADDGASSTIPGPPLLDPAAMLPSVGMYRGRLNVTASDYDYANLEGPDPEPSRPHVLWLSGFDADKLIGVADVSRRIGRLPQGRYRTTILRSKEDAFIELLDVEDFQLAFETIKTKLKPWRIATYREYEAQRRAKLEHDLGGAQQEQARCGGGKRDRSPAGESPRHPRKKSVCSIM